MSRPSVRALGALVLGAVPIVAAVALLVVNHREAKRDRAELDVQRHAAEFELAKLEAESAKREAEVNRLKARQNAKPPIPVYIDVPWPRNDTPYPNSTAPVPIDPSRRNPRELHRKTKVEPYRTP